AAIVACGFSPAGVAPRLIAAAVGGSASRQCDGGGGPRDWHRPVGAGHLPVQLVVLVEEAEAAAGAITDQIGLLAGDPDVGVADPDPPRVAGAFGAGVEACAVGIGDIAEFEIDPFGAGGDRQVAAHHATISGDDVAIDAVLVERAEIDF